MRDFNLIRKPQFYPLKLVGIHYTKCYICGLKNDNVINYNYIVANINNVEKLFFMLMFKFNIELAFVRGVSNVCKDLSVGVLRVITRVFFFWRGDV